MSRHTYSGADPALLERIDARQERLQRARPAPAALERLWEGLLPDWIAGSNALDGNRLTRDETAQLLTDGARFDDRTLREHLEALNHRAAIAEARRLAGQRRPLRASVVRRLHALLQAHIEDDTPGQYRAFPLDSDAGASVADQMRRWELWLQTDGADLHPLERAAVSLSRLSAIMPFRDGNGRVARLTMNLSLLRDGYLPAILRYEQRHDYRLALYQAGQGSYAGLVTLIAGAIERVQGVYLLAFGV